MSKQTMKNIQGIKLIRTALAPGIRGRRVRSNHDGVMFEFSTNSSAFDLAGLSTIHT
jgi:hypothetical protein